ncbi:MAG: gamma-glutamylcyclotransferase family protein [Smithellaceae bacterium]
MQNLFAYGTLMCEDIMTEVSGCLLSCEPGIVKGYSRRAVKGEPYPALVYSEAGLVEGIVYRDLPMRAWERLDHFEGEMYARLSVQVELAGQLMLPAQTYVVQPEFRNRLEKYDWDFAKFLSHGKEIFQRHYKGYALIE